MVEDSGIRTDKFFAQVDAGGIGVVQSDERVLELLKESGYPTAIVAYRQRFGGIMGPEDFPGQVRGQWAFDMILPGVNVAVQYWPSRQDTNMHMGAQFPGDRGLTRGEWVRRTMGYLWAESAKRGLWLINLPRDQTLDAAFIKAERERFLAARPATIVVQAEKPADTGIRSSNEIKPDASTGLGVLVGL